MFLASCVEKYFLQPVNQGQIKVFVGPSHFSSLGPFGDLTSIAATTVYTGLFGLMKGEGMHEYLRNTNNPNFIFHTLDRS
jgi:hypothetical protein